MSTYLNASIERYINKKWTHFMDLTYEEGKEIVNPRILKDVFHTFGDWDGYAYKSEITPQTELHLGIKIQRSGWPISKEDTWYPYKYNLRFYKVVEGLNKDTPDYLINFLKYNESYNDTIKSKTDLIEKIICTLEIMSSTLETKYCEVGIEVDKSASFSERAKIVTNGDGRTYIGFSTPYEALTVLRYTKEIDPNILKDSICYLEFLTEEGDIVPQYSIESNTYVSYPEDLKVMTEELQSSIDNVKKTKKDTYRLRNLLNIWTADFPEEYWNNPMGEWVKKTIGDNTEEFSDEYLEDLENQLEELKVLIRIVGSNGRIIWNIM